jgi:hypothetical protein
MPYVLDESSYRIDKTMFPTIEEAKQRAAEASRILGRAIAVYELTAGELNFAFRVMPDGSVEETQPTVEHQSPEPDSPVALGSVPRKRHVDVIGRLDEIATVLELAGRPDLASVVDREAFARTRPSAGVANLARQIKAKRAR